MVTPIFLGITALLAKIGLKATLVIDGVSYTNCAIRSWGRLEEGPPGTWWYEVTFVRDTT